MKRILAAVLATMVALAGCSGSEEPEQTASSSTNTTSLPPRIPGVEGRFLSFAGENYFDAGLYELRLWPVQLDPLTSVRRVSSIGACETRVVVAAAQAEVGYADRLQVFSGGRFGPVDNLGSPHAFVPKLASDCRMLYTDFPKPGAEGDQRVHLWKPSDATDTVIASHPASAASVGVPPVRLLSSNAPGPSKAPNSRTSPSTSSISRAAPAARSPRRQPAYRTCSGVRRTGWPSDAGPRMRPSSSSPTPASAMTWPAGTPEPGRPTASGFS